MLVRDRVSRIFYLRKFFDYPISLKIQTFKNMGLWRTIQAGFGYLFAAVCKRKEESLEDFYINRFGKPLYSMFFEDYTEKLWGVHPSQISPDWGAQRVKGLSLVKAVLSALTKPFHKDAKQQETSLIEQYLYPKKGPGQYWEIMARKIQELGGTCNGSTAMDGTNYYETVPRDALEKVLWMESDRMGFFINTVTQAGLEREIDVVSNEKRQGENCPFGQSYALMLKYFYPEGLHLRRRSVRNQRSGRLCHR